MQIARVTTASICAVALAATLGSVSASGQAPTGERATEVAIPGQPASVEGTSSVAVVVPEVKAPAFAILAGVKAVPMDAAELRAVKGQHAHFATPSKNDQFGEVGLHIVNSQNLDAWVDLGNGEIVGPGYHGLCGAALKSPMMSIPGQNEAGIGGGC